MLFEHIFNNVKMYPDKLAVKDSSRSLSYLQLWEEIVNKNIVAGRKGVSRNTKILLVMNNSCDCITDFLAFAMLGAQIIMISPDSRERQIHQLTSQMEITEMITDRNRKKYFSFKNKEKIDEKYVFPDSKCEIIYQITSGSTDNNKICIRTIGELVAEGEMFQDRLCIRKDDVIMCPLPIYHSYAFGAAIITGLISGASIIVLKNFIPRQYLKALLNNNVTISFVIPVMARLLVNTKLTEDIDLSCMRYLVVGAGSISKEVYVGFLEKYNIVLSSNYGSTETGGVLTRIDESSYPSVGCPMKGVFVEIRSKTGENVENGKEGELWIKAPSVMNRYYGKANVFDKRGFFMTGDLAIMDNNGNCYITGRIKNIVNVGGKKVNPNYVEKIIKQFSKVKDAVVVGNSRKNGEEYLVALYTGCSNFEIKEFQSYLIENLESYMIPSILKKVDFLPYNDLGKLEKVKILELALT